MNIQHNRGLLRSRSNIWSGGAVKLWLPWSNGCSIHYDYHDFWMKIWFKANFWPRSRILKVKKRKIIRISLGIRFWGLNCILIDIYWPKFKSKIRGFWDLFPRFPIQNHCIKILFLILLEFFFAWQYTLTYSCTLGKKNQSKNINSNRHSQYN